MTEPTPFDTVHQQLKPQREQGFGSITLLIQQASSGNPESNDLLFTAVIKQLQETASRVLRAFPNPHITDPDVLVSDIYERLCARLVGEQINNRQQFFGTACNHFRWILLDELKKKRPATPAELPDNSAETTAPEDALVFSETVQLVIAGLDQLDVSLQDVINAHLFLEMTFEEISVHYDIARSTAHDRYVKAIHLLRKQLAVREPETG